MKDLTGKKDGVRNLSNTEAGGIKGGVEAKTKTTTSPYAAKAPKPLPPKTGAAPLAAKGSPKPGKV